MIEGKVNKKHLLIEVKERDGLICGICKDSLEKEWRLYETWVSSPYSKISKRYKCNITLDHKVPRSVLRRKSGFVYEKGWQWKDKENLQLAHLSCNIKKGNGTD